MTRFQFKKKKWESKEGREERKKKEKKRIKKNESQDRFYLFLIEV